MKTQKGSMIVITVIIIVAITAGVFGWMFAKNSQAPAQQILTTQVTTQPVVPVTQNQQVIQATKSDTAISKSTTQDNNSIIPTPAVAVNTKNSIGINTRAGYNSAISLIKNKGNFELRDMIFTKYFSEADKNKTMILFTFYLSEKNREVQIKYYTKTNKSITYLQYDLNNSKEAKMASVLNKKTIPQTAIDYGFERAIAKIETNDDYLKIPNKISNFPWVSLNNGPNGWEFQTMVDAKGNTNDKEKYSFTVNLDKSQVFFERRS